jgi:hypothetical protein
VTGPGIRFGYQAGSARTAPSVKRCSDGLTPWPPPPTLAKRGGVYARKMLVEIHFPFADLRYLIHAAPGRLDRPSWPFPIPLQEFVRRTGDIQVRRKGSIDPWGDERCYCSAAKAIRFPDRLHKYGPGNVEFQGVFRRLFFDGAVVGRFAVGLSPSKGHLGLAMDHALALPTRIWEGDQRPLISGGPALAAHWLAASTAAGDGGELDLLWSTAGTPLIIGTSQVSQFGSHQDLELARRLGKEVDLFNSSGVVCLFRRLTVGRTVAEAWALLSEPGADPGLIRRLRIHLGRLHAEREALKAVFRAIRSGSISAEYGSDQLQRYLDRALSWQESKAPSGITSSDILEATAKAQDLVTEGERRQLLMAVSEIRGNIRAKIERVTSHAQLPQQPVFVQVESITMSDDHSTNIQADQVSGVVGGQGNTVDSLSARIELVRGSAAPSAVREVLEDLAPAFNNVVAKLPENEKGDAERDLDDLIQASVEKEVDLERVQTLSQRVADRAKAVGAVGVSALALISELVKLFG